MAKKQNFIVGSTNPNTNTWTTSELNNGWDKYQVLKSGDLDGVFKAVSDYSNDSSQEIWNAIRILKGSNPTGASTSELGNIISTVLGTKATKATDFMTQLTSNNKGATEADLNTLREEIETSSLTFKGYVATSAPSASTYGLVEGNIWINSASLPTTFPVSASSIRVWNGTSWVTTTETYTAKDFDFFRNINDNEGYYWFGGQWTVMSTDMSTTYFTLNQTSGKWEIKSSVNLPGSPTTTTPAAGDNSTKIATTKFVADSFAPLASPALTGTPTAPTATAGTANTQIATTAFVADSFAPLASPALTGTPTAPTATAGTANTQIATTAFVADSFAPLASPALTGTPTATTPTSSSPDNQIATKKYVDEAIAPLPTTTYFPDLFDHKWADHELDDMQWLRADNFSWQDGGAYETAYQHLTADITGKTLQSETIGGTTIQFYLADDGHKICPADQTTNAMLIYNATGVAWYYVLDTTNERFILPRTRFGFTGLRDGVGKYVAPGLPNITGSISMINPAPNDYRSRFTAGSGALKGTGTLSAGRSPSTSETGNGYPNASLDASWSNSIYGNSTTVQAPATQMYLYFYVGSFTQTAIENTAGLNSELFNDKADVDLSNAVSNASVAAKETIVGWGMPDYNSGISFSNDTNYTAPKDGFVIASGYTSTSTNSYFNLNGTRMATFIANTSAWLPAMVYCPVCKGDIIRINFTQGTYTMNFYPFKGAQ